MAQRWFYRGGLVPECWSSTLKVEGGRLYGTHDSQDCEILPGDIIAVKEFGFNNPFLLITTADGKFHVGAMTKQYDEVVHILERYVGSSFCQRFVHRWNVLFFRKQFGVSSFVKRLLRGVKRAGRP